MLATNSSLLKNALFIDSLFSLLSGIAFLLFSKAVASLLGVSASWIIPALGVGVIVYAIEIYLAARAEPVPMGIARFAVYGNLVWVLGSVLLIFANPVPFSTAGKWTIAILADVVLVFAILQHVGLRRLTN
jgi:cytochrome c oxidase assembly factor CtaG